MVFEEGRFPFPLLFLLITLKEKEKLVTKIFFIFNLQFYCWKTDEDCNVEDRFSFPLPFLLSICITLKEKGEISYIFFSFSFFQF